MAKCAGIGIVPGYAGVPGKGNKTSVKSSPEMKGESVAISGEERRG